MCVTFITLNGQELDSPRLLAEWGVDLGITPEHYLWDSCLCGLEEALKDELERWGVNYVIYDQRIYQKDADGLTWHDSFRVHEIVGHNYIRLEDNPNYPYERLGNAW